MFLEQYLCSRTVQLPLWSPLIILVPPVSPKTEQLNNYSSLVSSRSYFPIIIYLFQIPGWFPLTSCFFVLSLLGDETCMVGISKFFLFVSQQISLMNHVTLSCWACICLASLQNTHSRKSIPIKVGTVSCRHFMLACSPLISKLWGFIFLNNRSGQSTAAFSKHPFNEHAGMELWFCQVDAPSWNKDEEIDNMKHVGLLGKPQ